MQTASDPHVRRANYVNRVLKVQTTYYPGYGGPPEWVVTAICENRLLRSIVCSSEKQAGRYEFVLETEIGCAINAIDLGDYPLASPLCSNCGGDTLDGCSYQLDRTWCKKSECQTAQESFADQYRHRIEQRDREEKLEQQQRDELRQARLEEWRTGFHATNGWYFKRMPDGSVRIAKPDTGYVMIEFPPNIWASIVCSVSADGETLDRWNASQDFHGRTAVPQPEQRK